MRLSTAAEGTHAMKAKASCSLEKLKGIVTS